MIPLTNDAILSCIKMHEYAADVQKETNQIFTILKIGEREVPLFLRVLEESQLLQLLAFIPCPLEPKKVSDIARLLHMLNKEVDLPGFGMDEVGGVLFYRIMLAAPNKKLDQNMLITYMKVVKNVCELFIPPIETIGFGYATLEDILKKMQNEGSTKG